MRNGHQIARGKCVYGDDISTPRIVYEEDSRGEGEGVIWWWGRVEVFWITIHRKIMVWDLFKWKCECVNVNVDWCTYGRNRIDLRVYKPRLHIIQSKHRLRTSNHIVCRDVTLHQTINMRGEVFLMLYIWSRLQISKQTWGTQHKHTCSSYIILLHSDDRVSR